MLIIIDRLNFNDENAKKIYGDGIILGGEPVLIEKME